MKRQFKNIKELPGCPIGRIFKESNMSGYFHSISEDEYSTGEFWPYDFSLEIMENTEWFMECGDNYMVRSYDPTNWDQYTDIDTEIPNYLVDAVKNGLNVINGKLSVTPILISTETYDIKWGIIEYHKGGSKLKYRVTISKEQKTVCSYI